MSLGVLILVGGKSTRMGADKASQLWGDRRAVDHLAALSQALRAAAVVTAGAGDYGLPLVADGEVDGGPVCGLVAGGAALARLGCERVLALAVDAPTIAPGDVSPLIAAPTPGAAYRGLNLPLTWDLAATPVGARAGWPVGRFIEAAGLRLLACPPAAEARLRGANTPAERAALLGESAQNRGGA